MILDNIPQLNICNLRRDGYLKPGQIRSGFITWRWHGGHTVSILITVHMTESPFVELSYKAGNEPRTYRIWLISVLSNLGTGKVWYFICPKTGKRCRVLHLIYGWFVHRDAYSGCLYDSQANSKSMRSFVRDYGHLFAKNDKFRDELRKPYFKTRYNGKPTKRYLRIMKKLHT